MIITAWIIAILGVCVLGFLPRPDGNHWWKGCAVIMLSRVITRMGMVIHGLVPAQYSPCTHTLKFAILVAVVGFLLAIGVLIRDFRTRCPHRTILLWVAVVLVLISQPLIIYSLNLNDADQAYLNKELEEVRIVPMIHLRD